MVYMENLKLNGTVISFNGYDNKKKENPFHYSFDIVTGETLEDTGGSEFKLSEAKYRIFSVLYDKGQLPDTLMANTH